MQSSTIRRQAYEKCRKSTHFKQCRQVQPLSLLQRQKAEIGKKTKIIQKPSAVLKMSAQERAQKCMHQNQQPKQIPKHSTKKILQNKQQQKEKQKQLELLSFNFQKYLPQKCDEFMREDQEKTLVQTKTQNFVHQLFSNCRKVKEESDLKQKKDENIDIAQLRLMLGFDVKKQVQQEVMVAEVVEPVKDDGTGLFFKGRPFEQAKPPLPPKKIHQYPPPCKVAGLYQWPHPKSEYRRWKGEMRESRKLK